MKEKKQTLEEWTKNCPNLEAVFNKAKEENREISVIPFHIDYNSSERFNVIEARKDYAVILMVQPGGGIGEPPMSKYSTIHPFGGNLMYHIEDLDTEK